MPEYDSSIEYRDVEEFPGYAVGNDGSMWTCREQIRSNEHRGFITVMRGVWRRLKPIPNRDGYNRISLCRDNKVFNRSIHRLVLEAFVGPCPDGMMCCHRDGRRNNNYLWNIRWGTAADNLADSIAHGTWMHGEIHGRAILDEDQVVRIMMMLGDGHRQTDIAAFYDVNKSVISAIARGRSWKHVAKAVAPSDAVA